MEKQSFIALVKRYYPWICSMEKAAFRIHDDVNQKYDHVLPYGFHLKMTVSYVSRYGYLVAETEADILILYASAFLHDTIEDARMTYNDVVKFLKEFKGGGFVLPEGVRQHLEDQVPEIERANDLYYQGIRQTKFASFIKICDRLANIQYTMMFVFANRMLDVYRREYPEFIRSISEGAVTQVPDAMKEEAERLLNSESYII